MWAELGALIAASVIVLVALVIVRTIFPKSGELLTLILTSATAIILFLQFRTLDKTDRTLRETLKANQFAQRAFVVADEVAIVPVGPVEGGLPNNWTVSAILENGGTTATRNMTFFPESHGSTRNRFPKLWISIPWMSISNVVSGSRWLWDHMQEFPLIHT